MLPKNSEKHPRVTLPPGDDQPVEELASQLGVMNLAPEPSPQVNVLSRQLQALSLAVSPEGETSVEAKEETTLGAGANLFDDLRPSKSTFDVNAEEK